MQGCIVLLLLLLAGCATPPRFDYTALPEYHHDCYYGVGEFIPQVMALQAMGREAACAELLRIDSDEVKDPGVYIKVVVLCRMLFVFQEGKEYTPPVLYETLLHGETKFEDWPLVPIEIVNGYPFWIVDGFRGGGWRPPVSEYVTYCMKNCQWNTYRFHKLNEKEENAALTKLLNSPKWKRPLNDEEKRCLSSQVGKFRSVFYQ